MKKILVVGGSKGIGNAILQNEIRDNVVINLSRSEPQIQHPNLSHHNIDVLQDELPVIESLNGLVYCPGSINLKPIRSLKLNDFKDDYEINVLGAVKTIQQYLRALRSQSGSIVLFSTVAVGQGMPFHSSIAAAKGGVEGLTRSLAAELAPDIRVNAIAPTITNTSLASKILRNEEAIERMAQRHPLKRIIEPAEIANMASFLLSSNAASITGQIIGIDAGLSSLKL